MNDQHPSIPEVLSELGGLGFVLGTVVMSWSPLALPALIFGLLLLPLLLPVALLAALYGLLVALPRRYFASRKARRSPSDTSTARPPTRTTVGVPG
jgi:hypothetical protein